MSLKPPILQLHREHNVMSPSMLLGRRRILAQRPISRTYYRIYGPQKAK